MRLLGRIPHMTYCTTVLLLFPVLSGCQCWQKQNQRGPGHLQGGGPRSGSQVHSVRAVRRPRRQRHLHEGRHGAAPHHPPELGGDAAAHRGGLGSSQGNTALICRLRVVTSASKSSIRRFVITEKAPIRAFSWLKAATTAFTFKTLC